MGDNPIEIDEYLDEQWDLMTPTEIELLRQCIMYPPYSWSTEQYLWFEKVMVQMGARDFMKQFLYAVKIYQMCDIGPSQ